jgi:hypothetical protein
MSTKNHIVAMQSINFVALFQSREILTWHNGYVSMFLNIRGLWSDNFLNSEQALHLTRQLKCDALDKNEIDKFPEEANQFIFMLEGSEK